MFDSLTAARWQEKFSTFFFGKKETLAQSLVDGAAKAVFSGIIVSVAALYVLGAVEDSMERSKNRAALQSFQNSMLSEGLSVFSSSFSQLNCARTRAGIIHQDCVNGMDAFITLLHERSELLESIHPDGDFSSIQLMIEAAKQMREIRDIDIVDQQQIQYDRIAKVYSERFANMMRRVASNFT